MENKKLKVVEAFAGYGSQRIALNNLGYNKLDSKIIEWSINPILAYANIHHKAELQVEKERIRSFADKDKVIEILLRDYTLSTETKKVDGEYVPCDYNQYKRMDYDKLLNILAACRVSKNAGSIMETKGDFLNGIDLFTYSFPCQDLSLAGKMKGMDETTRSGLLYQVERMLKEQDSELRPRVLIMENVKNLVGKKFKPKFDEWLETLKLLGYETQWKVLNAKEHGVPQNRERVFAVSIRKGALVDFTFDDVKTKPLDKVLKDFLEEKVDDKYYLSDSHIMRILGWNSQERPLKKVYHLESDNVGTITTRSGDDTGSQKLVIDTVVCDKNIIDIEDVLNGKNLILGINPSSPTYKSDNIVHGENSFVSTLRAGNGTQLIAVRVKDYDKSKNFFHIEKPEGGINGNFNRVWKDKIVGTITTRGELSIEETLETDLNDFFPIRIRKLTQREALRLMGMSDADISLIFEIITAKSAQYKLAGNSIVVNVLEDLFRAIKWGY